MSIELVFEGYTYDNGYGEQGGDLVLEVSPVYTDERFYAFNTAGVLSIYGNSRVVTDFELDYAFFFIIGQDGSDIGQVEFDLDDVYKYLDKETILRHLSEALD